MSKPCVILVFTLSALSASLSLAQDAGPESKPDAPAWHADRATVTAFLDALIESHEPGGRVHRLIEKLGEVEYASREAAMRELEAVDARAADAEPGDRSAEVGVLPVALSHAMGHPDPEIRLRARLLRSRGAPWVAGQRLHAALRAIEQTPHKGLVDPLVRLIRMHDRAPLDPQMPLALAATAEADDVAKLTGLLDADTARLRQVGLIALARLEGEGGADRLAKALGDPAPSVRLAAARALAERGDKRCVEPLIDLVALDEAGVSGEALMLLRATTGQRMGVTLYASDREQREKIGKWRAWAEANLEGLKIELPLRLQGSVALRGLTLVCDYQANRVTEYDARGNQTWSTQVDRPYACQGLGNGHRLIGSFGEQVVIEYNEAGREVWRSQKLGGGAMGVERLDNGRTLVACSDANMIVEVDATGQVVWRVSVDGRPVDVQRLVNGHTLVTLQKAEKVVELDRNGKVVWSLGGLGDVQTAHRMPDGKTMVAIYDANEVRLYNRDQNVTWRSPALENPVDAQPLGDGRFLVTEQQGALRLVDMDGSISDFVRGGAVLGRADRY